MKRQKVWVALGIILLLLGVREAVSEAAPAAPSAGDAYSRALARSAKQYEAGQIAAAIATLRAIAAHYPQDYALALRLGWFCFEATRYSATARYFNVALALAPRSREASYGLHISGIRRRASEPNDLDLLAQARLVGQLYSGHPARRSALGLAVDLDTRLYRLIALSARYRYTSIAAGDSYAAQLGRARFTQHELYLSAGLWRSGASAWSPRARLGDWSLLAHSSVISDGSGTFGTTYQLGVSASLSLGRAGTLGVSASHSPYDDLSIVRFSPSYALTLGPLTLATSLTVARAETNDRLIHGQLLGQSNETLLSAQLSATARLSWGALFVGGRLGTQVRPTDFSLGVSANTYDRVGAGLWAGTSIALGRSGLGLTAGYELAWLKTPTDETGASLQSSTAHFFNLGLTWGR